jgi:hypothetical protein
MITYDINIHFQAERAAFSDMVFTSGDARAYKLRFFFFDAGKAVDLSGTALVVKARRADGAVISDSGEIDAAENCAEYVVKNSMYDVEGELIFEIALADADGGYGTAKVLSASVRAGLGEPALDAHDNFPILVSLIERVRGALDSADGIIDALSGPYGALNAHIAGRDNPHGVTKEQLGVLPNYPLNAQSFAPAADGASVFAFTLLPNTVNAASVTNAGYGYTLNLSFGAPQGAQDCANEYLFQLSTGSAAPTVRFPQDVKWFGGEPPQIKANKAYLFGILFNEGVYLAVGGEFA